MKKSSRGVNIHPPVFQNGCHMRSKVESLQMNVTREVMIKMDHHNAKWLPETFSCMKILIKKEKYELDRLRMANFTPKIGQIFYWTQNIVILHDKLSCKSSLN